MSISLFFLSLFLFPLLSSSQSQSPIPIGPLSTLAHEVSATLLAISQTTLLLENFIYDGQGPAAVFWLDRTPSATSSGIIPLSQDTCSAVKILPAFTGESALIELPEDSVLTDFRHFSIWSELVGLSFGGIDIDPAIAKTVPEGERICASEVAKVEKGEEPFPVKKGWNCEELRHGFHVRWLVDGFNAVRMELVGRLEEGQYMGFGPSGSDVKTAMVKSDVVIAYQSGGEYFAVDYFMSAKTPCADGVGVCPDDFFANPGSNDVSKVSGDTVDGITIVRFTRPRFAADAAYDRTISLSSPMFVNWAIGQLDSSTRLPVFHVGEVNFPKEDVSINFGRAAADKCEKLVASDVGEKSVPGFIRPTISGVSGITARIGPTAGSRGYTGITGGPGRGFAWHMSPSGENGKDVLIPAIAVERGKTYTFTVQGGLDEPSKRGNPLYITSSARGGYDSLTPKQRAEETVFAGITGIVTNSGGDVVRFNAPVVGALCQITSSLLTDTANLKSWDVYAETLDVSCADNGSIMAESGELVWTVPDNAPDILYYQSVTRQFLGFKIAVFDKDEVDLVKLAEVNGGGELRKSDAGTAEGVTSPCVVTFKGEEMKYKGCKKGLGGNIEVYWTVREDDGELDTLFRAPTKGGYVGFGWGFTEMTEAAAVVAFADDSGEAVIRDYFMQFKASSGVQPDSKQKLTKTDAEVSGSFVTGIFTRKLKLAGLPAITNGDTPAIWAVGPMPGAPTELDIHTARGVVTIDLADVVEDGPVPLESPENGNGNVPEVSPEKEDDNIPDVGTIVSVTNPCNVTFKGEEMKYKGCKKGLGGNIEVYWTVREDDGELDTLFRAPTKGGYVGFGWGFTEMTEAAAVVAFADDSGEAVIRDYFMQFKTSSGVQPDSKQKLTKTDAEISGSFVTGIFTRKLKVAGLPAITNGDTPAIWAVGPMPGAPTELDIHTARGVVTIDLADVVEDGPVPLESPENGNGNVPEVSPEKEDDNIPDVGTIVSVTNPCNVTFKGEEMKYKGCKKGLGGNIEVYWTVREDDGELDTLFRAPTKGGYVGFGWGFTEMTEAAAVVAFADDSGEAVIRDYFMQFKASSGVQPDSKQKLTKTDAEVSGSYVTGIFTRKLKVAGLPAITNGDTPAIWAVGPMPGAPTELDIHTARGVVTIDLADVVEDGPVPLESPENGNGNVPEVSPEKEDDNIPDVGTIVSVTNPCNVTFKGEEMKYKGCKKGLGGNIEVYWTVREDDGELDTLFRAPTKGGYVGFGWGFTEMTEAAAVVAFADDSGEAVIRDYFMQFKTSSGVQPDSKQKLTKTDAEVSGSFVTGIFTRKLKVAGLPAITNGDTPAIWAVGPMPGAPTELDIHTARGVVTIDLADVVEDGPVPLESPENGNGNVPEVSPEKEDDNIPDVGTIVSVTNPCNVTFKGEEMKYKGCKKGLGGNIEVYWTVREDDGELDTLFRAPTKGGYVGFGWGFTEMTEAAAVVAFADDSGEAVIRDYFMQFKASSGVQPDSKQKLTKTDAEISGSFVTGIFTRKLKVAGLPAITNGDTPAIWAVGPMPGAPTELDIHTARGVVTIDLADVVEDGPVPLESPENGNGNVPEVSPEKEDDNIPDVGTIVSVTNPCNVTFKGEEMKYKGCKKGLGGNIEVYWTVREDDGELDTLFRAPTKGGYVGFGWGFTEMTEAAAVVAFADDSGEAVIRDYFMQFKASSGVQPDSKQKLTKTDAEVSGSYVTGIFTRKLKVAGLPAITNGDTPAIWAVGPMPGAPTELDIHTARGVVTIDLADVVEDGPVPLESPENGNGNVPEVSPEKEDDNIPDVGTIVSVTNPCNVTFKGEEMKYKGCKKGLGGNIEVYWTVREDDGELDTLFRAPTKGGYVGFGWGFTEMTEAAAVVAFADDSGEAVIRDYFMQFKTSSGVQPDSKQKLTKTDAEISGSFVTGIFTRKLKVAGLPAITNGDTPAIWAVGPMPGAPTELDIHTARGVVTIDLADVVEDGPVPLESPENGNGNVPEVSPEKEDDNIPDVGTIVSVTNPCNVTFKGEEMKYKGCKKGLGGNIEVYWTVREDDGELDTLFRAPTKGGYVGFGWGFTEMTEAAAVVAFADDSGEAVIRDYFMQFKASSGVQPDSKQKLTKTDAEVSGSYVTGIFTRKLKVAGLPAITNGDTPAIWAVGPMPGAPTELDIHTARGVVTIDLADVVEDGPVPLESPENGNGNVPEVSPEKEDDNIPDVGTIVSVTNPCNVTFKGEEMKYKGCKKGLGGNIEVYWTVREDDGELDTLFRAPTKGGYVGFGWGFTEMTEAAAVVAFADDSGEAVIRDYFMQFKTSSGVQPDSKQKLTKTDAEISGSFVTGIFTRKLKVAGLPAITNGDTPAIWAVGPMPGAPTELDIHTARGVVTIDLADVVEDGPVPLESPENEDEIIPEETPSIVEKPGSSPGEVEPVDCTVMFKGVQKAYEGCRTSLGPDVEVYWTLREDNEEIDTLFRAPTDGGYVGFGWASNEMVGSSAVIAFEGPDGPIIDDYFLESKTSEGVQPNSSRGLIDMDVEVNEGYVTGIFTRKLNLTVTRAIQNGPTRAIWAVGKRPESATNLGDHTMRGIEEIDISERQPSASVSPSSSPSASSGGSVDVSCEVMFNEERQLFAGCTKDLTNGLEVYWRFREGDGELDTLFRARTNGGYVGFGWGYTKMVGSKAVVAFQGESGNGEIDSYFLKGKNTNDVQPQSHGIQGMQAGVDDGFVAGFFTRKLEVEGLPPIRNGKMEAFWAVGGRPDGKENLQTHARNSRGSGTIDLSASGSSSAEIKDIDTDFGTFFVVHGVLMVVAWFVLAPLAILAMRYFKRFNPMSFWMHRGLNIAAVLITLIGIIMGLSRGNRDHIAHLVVGIVVGVLMLLQASGGFLRPSKDAPIRNIWSFGHWFGGYITHGLGMANVWVGLSVIDAGVGYFVACGVLIGLFVLAQIVLGCMWRTFPVGQPVSGGSKSVGLEGLENETAAPPQEI